MPKDKSNTRTSRSRAEAAPPKEPKVHYLSINDQEFERLRHLGFRERWAYMELKNLSNWKTGTCGQFDRQRITYAQIASLVTAPGVQGRGQGDIDDKQAADFLKRMEVLGLVANIGRRANGGLRFDMPLGPIQRPEAGACGEFTAQLSGEKQVFSPDIPEREKPANPASMQVCEAPATSLSVMINKELNINTDGAASAIADAAPCRAAGAAPARENPPPPLPQQPAAEPIPAPRLSAREIQRAIESDWTFTETATPQAQALYESWAEAGITLQTLQEAMVSLDEDPARPELTPANLGGKLWPSVVDAWFDQMAA